DIITQVETVGKVVPADYKFDVDFNGFLLNQAKAEEILSQLDEHRNVGIYESPFWLARDPEGAKLLKSRIRKPVAEHFQEPVLHDRTSDAFVIGGCAGDTTRHGTLAASFNKPFWLQMVGTGLTTTFAGHIGSVLSHAQLPYITCHELWRDDLVTRPVKVVDGYMDVPDGPGLGVEADEKAIEKYTVDPKEITGTQKYRAQKRILRVVWPGAGKNGRVWEFTDEMVYQPEFYKGNLPGFERGVHLEIEEDDKSAAFRKAHARLLEREALTVRG
ncbi:MAG: enolase, partial [candidate division Zixibacteria bacterium]|nr:enolase [candidate division Zixibacteria bacterium]